MDEEIIHVLMLKLSAIQNPTKFQGPHWRLSGSTGLRSWFVNCLVNFGLVADYMTRKGTNPESFHL